MRLENKAANDKDEYSEKMETQKKVKQKTENKENKPFKQTSGHRSFLTLNAPSRLYLVGF